MRHSIVQSYITYGIGLNQLVSVSENISQQPGISGPLGIYHLKMSQQTLAKLKIKNFLKKRENCFPEDIEHS